MIKISEKWTPVERLKVVVAITDIIRDEINLDRYGMPGKPNIQSVHEFISATPSELEEIRSDIEKLVNSKFTEQDWNEMLVGM